MELYNTTDSMEHIPFSEADSFPVNQTFLRLLFDQKCSYRIYKSPPLVLVVSHMYPIHMLGSCFLKFNFNIILPSTPRSSEWPFNFHAS
jgi:hypothetical protein